MCYAIISNTVGITFRVSYKRQELLLLREQLCSPLFLIGSVLLIFLVFCVAFLFSFVCLRPVSCVPLCCQCPWIVNSLLSFWAFFNFIILQGYIEIKGKQV